MHSEPTLWHALAIEPALAALQTERTGLSDQEAAARLVRFGPNRLTPPEPVSALVILRDQLTSVVVFLLVAAAIISLLLGDRLEAAAIAAVLVINTLIGFLTEWRARRAMEALRELDTPRASVVRDGHLRVIDAQTLVPGDIIELSAGHQVPADARVIHASDLRTTEAALTGESLPVSKTGVARALSVAALASRQQAASDGSQTEAVQDGTAESAGPLVDPVDAAVLRAAMRVGITRAHLVQQHPVLSFVPFSSERKFMAFFYEVDGRVTAFAKGAPRRILSMCERVAMPDGERALDDAARSALMATNNGFAERGLRVLAIASGPVRDVSESALQGLTFVGFLGLADPPATGVRETIARLRTAGLETVMLTGDQRLTAEAIGRELGLLGPDDHAMDGRGLDALTGADLDLTISQTRAFSRVTPEHKLIIVQSLQARGQIVAMLGDGINDAAALKKADVGVAMGNRGTDVAKEAAAIVLQDDRFETIAAAVEEGRIIFDNIRKFVFYLFSCNVAEVLVLLVAGLTALPLPLAPLQLLWLNMVTDTFPALALAMEPGDPDVMRRPPRDPEEAILSRGFLSSVLAYGLLITASTLAAFVWALDHAAERASTMAFMTLALAQIGHLGNARSTAPVVRLERATANLYALAGVAVSVALQLAAVTVEPLARILRVVPLQSTDWLVVVFLASVPAISGQMLKLRRASH